MKKSPRSIDEIIENKSLVEFDRKPLDKHPLFGFVIAANDDFTLIQEFDTNAFILESYTVFRNKDIHKFAVYDSDEYFLREVISCRGIEPQCVDDIDLENWPSILSWVSQKYGFFIVETEKLHKNECYVGVLDEIKAKTFVLREIDTHARWWPTKTKYRYKDLTKLKFGGPYESTLAMVVEFRLRDS